MLIIHTRSATSEGGKITGTLTSRHTIALTYADGVISLDREDVLMILPALQTFAENALPLDVDEGADDGHNFG